MNRLTFLIFGIFFAVQPYVHGQELIIQGGLGVHAENTVNPELKQALPYGSVGILIKASPRWGLKEEFNYLSSSSRMGNLNIKYQTLEWNQWAQWYFGKDQTYLPYVALGLGISQDKVLTTLSGVTRKDHSRFYYNLGLGLGLTARWWERVALGGELRVCKFEQKKDPTVSGLFLLSFSI